MATLAFILIFFGVTALPITLFQWYEPTPLHVLFWVLSGALGLLVAAGVMISFLAIYGLLIRSVNPHNRRHQRVGNSLLRLGVRIMNVKLTVTGKENIPPAGKRFVLISNHQENHDVVIIKPVFAKHNICFVAKESLFSWPIVGPWVRKLGNIPMPKVADRRAAENMIKAIRLYKEGLPVSIFPEGQRTFKNEMFPFKPGAFKLVLKPQADILPVTIYNFCMAFKGWPFKRQRLKLHIHPMIPFEDIRDMNTIELSAYVQDIIERKLETFKASEK